MRFKATYLMVVLILGIIVSRSGSAEDTNWIAVGARAGISTTDKKENFEQLEVFATYRLPWGWQWPSGWILNTRLNASAGTLRSGGETGFIVSLGPGIALSSTVDGISLSAGSSATLLSKDNFGQEDLGGPLQFISHVGISFQLRRNLGAGYRLQHMSNASLYNPNPDLNLHMFELSYRF